jgi:hypothetical protein
MGLRLLAITSQDGQLPVPLRGKVLTVAYGEVLALALEAHYTAAPPSEEELEAHANIIDAVFARRSVLPVPPGVVFRSEDALRLWMELHSVVMVDTLAFLEDRVAARVHIRREGAGEKPDDVGNELSATAADCMRRLRRQAVTSVPLEREQATGIVLSAAFLVERERWEEFAAAVGKEREELKRVVVELTGPWPPYDFVRMDFGA